MQSSGCFLMAKAFNVRDIRRRVRRMLLEAGSGKETNPYAKDTRNRGGSKPEFPEQAMRRLMASLEDAKPGDTFYLTYGFSEGKMLPAVRAADIDPTGNPVYAYTTDKEDKLTAMLMGDTAHYTAKLSGIADNAQRAEYSAIQGTGSAVIVGQRMATLGLNAISQVAHERANRLSSLMDMIKGGQLTAVAAADRLVGLVDPADLKLGTVPRKYEDAVKAGKRVLQVVAGAIKAVEDGTAQFGEEFIKDETKAINGALMAVAGERLMTFGMNSTGVDFAEQVSKMFPKESDQSQQRIAALMKKIAGVDIAQKKKPTVGDAYAQQLAEWMMGGDSGDREAAQLLISTCVADCIYDLGGGQMKIKPGAALAMLEKGGTPASLVRHEVMLCLILIKESVLVDRNGEVAPREAQGGFIAQSPSSRGISEAISHAVSGKGNPADPLAATMWGRHLEPTRALAISLHVNGWIDLDVSSVLADSVRGRRDSAHKDRTTDLVFRARASLFPDIPLTERMDEKQIAEIGKVAGEMAGQGPVKPEMVQGILAAQARIAGSMAKVRAEDSYRSESSAAMSNDPRSSLVRIIKRVRDNDAAKFFYERVLSKRHFGVTLRCTGRVPYISMASDTVASAAGASEDESRRLTERTRPVFDVQEELPNRLGYSTMRDEEGLKRLNDFVPPAARTKAKGSTPEGTGVLQDPDESIRVIGPRRSRSIRTLMTTPAVKMEWDKLQKALEGEESLASAFQNRGDMITASEIAIPYIEKTVPSVKRGEGPDYVLSIERKYDSKLRPLNVTLQLLGAVKVDDRRHAGAVTKSRMKPIASAGLGHGLPSWAERRVVEKFDVKGRLYDPTTTMSEKQLGDKDNISRLVNKTRISLRNMIERAEEERDHSNEIRRGHLGYVIKRLKSAYVSPQNVAGERFESLVNATVTSIALDGFRSSVRMMSQETDASLPRELERIKNLSLTGEADAVYGIRGLKDATTLGKIVRALASLLTAERSGNRMEPQVNASAAITRAYEGMIARKTRAEIVASMRSLGLDRPSETGVYPILTAVRESRAEAANALRLIDDLGIPALIQTVESGAASKNISDDPASEDIGDEDIVPVSMLDEYRSLRSRTMALLGANDQGETLASDAPDERFKKVDDLIAAALDSYKGFKEEFLRSKVATYMRKEIGSIGDDDLFMQFIEPTLNAPFKLAYDENEIRDLARLALDFRSMRAAKEVLTGHRAAIRDASPEADTARKLGRFDAAALAAEAEEKDTDPRAEALERRLSTAKIMGSSPEELKDIEQAFYKETGYKRRSGELKTGRTQRDVEVEKIEADRAKASASFERTLTRLMGNAAEASKEDLALMKTAAVGMGLITAERAESIVPFDREREEKRADAGRAAALSREVTARQSLAKLLATAIIDRGGIGASKRVDDPQAAAAVESFVGRAIAGMPRTEAELYAAADDRYLRQIGGGSVKAGEKTRDISRILEDICTQAESLIRIFLSEDGTAHSMDDAVLAYTSAARDDLHGALEDAIAVSESYVMMADEVKRAVQRQQIKGAPDNNEALEQIVGLQGRASEMLEVLRKRRFILGEIADPLREADQMGTVKGKLIELLAISSNSDPSFRIEKLASETLEDCNGTLALAHEVVELAEQLVEGSNLSGLRHAISSRMKEVTHPSDIKHMYADVGENVGMTPDQALIIHAIIGGQTATDPIDPYEIGRRIINACLHPKMGSASPKARALGETLRVALFPVVTKGREGAEGQLGAGEIPRGTPDRNKVITAHARRLSRAYENVQAMVQALIRSSPKSIAAQEALLALGEALGIATVAPQAGETAYLGTGAWVNIRPGVEVSRGSEPFDLEHEAALAQHADEVRRGEVRSERAPTGPLPAGNESLFGAIVGRASRFDQLLTEHADIEVDGRRIADLSVEELVEAVAVGGPVEKSSSIAAEHIRAIISEIKGDFVNMSGMQATGEFVGDRSMSQDEFETQREEARAAAEVEADGAFDEFTASEVLDIIKHAVDATKAIRSSNRS